MILKIKSKIYQYTGIYLAKKEENDFLRKSKQMKNLESGGASSFIRNSKHLRRDDLIISLWQVENGFTTHCSTKKNSLLARLEIMYKQLKTDLGF